MAINTSAEINELEITDQNQDEFLNSLEGSVITKATREKDSGKHFPQGANGVKIWLEDGRVLIFGSWGYDADGLTLWVESS
jgi:hypothetical protein